MGKPDILPIQTILEKSLNAYQLDNPGTALWRAFEAVCYAREDFKYPVLDIGCGDGSFKNLIAELSLPEKKQKLSLGVDLLFARIPDKNTYDYWLQADATQIPFKSNYFNTVLSNCVIEHVKDYKTMLQEVNRALKSGGKFIFTAPSEYFNIFFPLHEFLLRLGLNKIALCLSEKRNKKLAHYNIISPDEWNLILEKYGFKLVSFQYIISKKMQRISFLIFDLYGLGVGSFTIGTLLRKIDLAVVKIIGKMPIIFLWSRILKNIFKKDFIDKINYGGGLFIVAEKK